MMAVFTVNSELDNTTSGDGLTTLREALVAAGASSGADQIRFDASLLDETITLSLGELAIDSDVTIIGLGADRLTIDANASVSDQRRVMTVSSGVTAVVEDISLVGGYATGAGGNVSNLGDLTLNRVRVADGTATFSGGGVDNHGDKLTISGSVIENNTAHVGAGVYSGRDTRLEDTTVRSNVTSGGNGGGVYHYAGDLEIERCTISNNRGGSAGGGAYLHMVNTNSSIEIANSTFSSNQADSYGGGLRISTGVSGLAARLTNVTVADNKLTYFGSGGGIYDAGSAIELRNSIVAQNKENNGSAVDDVSGTFVATSSYNLIGAINGSTGLNGVSSNSIWGSTASPQNAGLAPRYGYGGATETYALLYNSPAIDHGSDGLAATAGLVVDQRGFSRNVDDLLTTNGTGGTVDIGAFEFDGPITVVTSSLDNTTSGDGLTTLREALVAAATTPGTDQIRFANSLLDQTITLSLGELQINSNVKILGLGSGRLTIDANASVSDQRRVMTVSSGVTAVVEDISLVGGYATGAGGNVSNLGDLTLNRVRVADGTATFSGGGVDNHGDKLTISGSVIENNTAHVGAGVYSGRDTRLEDTTVRSNVTSGGNGGGVYHYAGDLEIERCTISNNQAGNTGGGAFLSIVNQQSSVKISNTTISSNQSNYYGGGMYMWTSYVDRVAELTNVTVADNKLLNFGYGGGIYAVGGYPSVKLNNTIVAQNKENNGGAVDDVYGAFVATSSYNLIGAIDGSTGLNGGASNSIWGSIAAPQYAGLSQRGQYGGPSDTYALLPDSPALDRGSDSLAAGAVLLVDQRGQSRKVDDPLKTNGPGGTVDIGAFEAGKSYFEVDTTNDELDGNYSPGDLSLREAIALAAIVPGANTIMFADELAGETLELTSGVLTLGTDVTIDGLGADKLTIDANGQGRAFVVSGGVTATIRGMTITGGAVTSTNRGGAIHSSGFLTVDGTVFEGNIAQEHAGAIYNSNGKLRVINSTFFDNHGGIAGGAISSVSSYSDAVVIEGSAFIENEASSGGAMRIHGSNGTGSAKIINSTFSGNNGVVDAGAIRMTNTAPPLTITNSTITNNHAGTDAGGLNAGGGSITLYNSIVVGNTGAYAHSEDILGNISSLSSHSILGADEAFQPGSNHIFTDNAGLAPLGDYGGPTKTHKLLSTSPAIDAGSNVKAVDASGVTLVYDQRGLSRFVDDIAKTNVGGANTVVDIGAYEYSLPLTIQYTNYPIEWPAHTISNRISYEVEVSIDGIHNWTPLQTLSPNDLLLFPSGDGRYYYRVRAITTNGAPTEWSNAAAELNAYHVYLSADVDMTGPSPKVKLSWPDESGLHNSPGSVTYKIYRKLPSQTSWGTAYATVNGWDGTDIRTSYTDTNVSLGQIYEYRVDRTGVAQGTERGYIAAGVNASDTLHENRGSVVLVVDDRFTSSLEFELARLQQDLVGDGWNVIVQPQHVFATDTADTSVKTVGQIRADIISAYNAHHNTSLEVRSVLLIGHIPVPSSGWYYPDGHGNNPRPLPADVFYGDIDGVWTDSTNYPFNPSIWNANGGVQNVANDGIFDPGYDSDPHPNSEAILGVPTAGDADGQPVELSVGRVDMHNMGKFDPQSTYSGNGNWQPYRIQVGEHYTGDFDWLALVSGDSTGLTSANPSAGVGEFRNIKIFEQGQSATAIDFTGYNNGSFLGAREPAGTNRYGYNGKGTGPDAATTVTASGTTVTMTGNSWRVVDVFGGNGITITPNTILEFEFRSSDPSQIVSIGFDRDGTNFNGLEFLNEDHMFRVRASGGNSVGWGREIDPALETELLRRYLDKDHAFRHGEFDAERRALINGSSFRDIVWQQFAPLFGIDNINGTDATTADYSISFTEELATNSYLWASGSGTGGFWNTANVVNNISSDHFANETSLAVFNALLGSFSVDTARTDALMRSVLANDGYGLVSIWTGFANYVNNKSFVALEHMGIGATIGETYVLQQSRGALYGAQFSGPDNQAETYYNLNGDPTLRMHIVAPPTNLKRVTEAGNNVRLTWDASSEDTANGGVVSNGGTFAGYHVYRADDVLGTYQRVSVAGQDLFTGTSVLVSGADPDGIYMVRAVKLEKVSSGTYYNLSQGTFSDGVGLIARVNAGGGAVDSLGGSFAADTSATPASNSNAVAAQSNTISTAAAIDLALAAASVPVGTNANLFKSARVDQAAGAPMQWDFSGLTGNGRYAVKLYFAEIDSNVDAIGERAFDVAIEGASVLDDFDIFGTYGANRGVVKTFLTDVSGDGNLDIDFSAVVGNPLVSAIEVFRL